MNKPIDRRRLAEFSRKWGLEADGAAFATHSSVLLPATRDGQPVMLKLTPELDEIRGGGLLAWWDGDGAVRVLERQNDAILMERATGTRNLVSMTLDGRDTEAVDIICSVTASLHRKRRSPLPPLEPIETLFRELLESGWDDLVVQTGRRMARDLIANQIDLVPLHGDIQHHNVLDTGNDGWRVIDPKGQFGERTYDYVNLFRNPVASIAIDSAVFGRRLDQVERIADIDPNRLCQWIVAFCALCLVWDYYPQGSPDADRTLAELALSSMTRD